MFRFIRLVVLAGAFGVGATLVLAPATLVLAAEQTVSNKVGTPLKAAQELAKQKRFKEALDKVNEADAVANKTPFEILTIQKFKVYIYAQLKDYLNVARAMEAALATGLLTADEAKLYRRGIAIYYFQGGNTAKGVAAAKDYLARYGDDPELQLLLASQAYKGGDYASAAEAAQKVVRSAEDAGKRPDEDALVLLVNSEFYLKRSVGGKHVDAYSAALEKLVSYYPKVGHWHDLLINAESRPGFSQKFKLDLFILKFTIGTLRTADEYVDMAETSLVQNFPAYSQKVIEAGMKAGVVDEGKAGRNKRLLATATQRAAAEKVTAADEADARGQATGESLSRLASTVESYGEHARAVQLFKEAITKGGLASLDTVRLHLGVAQLRGGQIAAGQGTLKLVKAKDGSSDLARYWMLYSRQL
jgi:hypothetical protein